MKMIPVDSSMIREVGYDQASHTLEVRFASGRQYRYEDVPSSAYDGLMEADSKGRYMIDNIIHSYPWRESGADAIDGRIMIEPASTRKQGDSFARRYPSIARWVLEQGRVEIGHDEWMNCFVLATDEGGTAYQGKSSYPSIDEALEDLDRGIGEFLAKL